MKQKIPNSPFATRLSGSAKETELRIRNIFQWKKKRPPVVVLVLAALIALFCGSLVSCQVQKEEPPVDSDIASDDAAELMTSPIQNGTITSQIHVEYLPWEATLSNKPMEYLTQEQRDLLTNLSGDKLPKEPADLYPLYYENVWKDTLIPMAADAAADVTLYGVVSAEKFSEDEESRAVVINAVDGIVLRQGARAVYYPLLWDNIVHGGNPWMSVRDFDGDGKAEAAVCLYAAHGTGVSVENLYIFDLDTMTYTVPDYSGFGSIEVEYDPSAHTAALTSGAESLTVDVPDYLEPLGEGACGNIVFFYEENGQIYCEVGLDFYDTVGYLAYAAAPVIWQDGGYCLGEIIQITPEFSVK